MAKVLLKKVQSLYGTSWCLDPSVLGKSQFWTWANERVTIRPHFFFSLVDGFFQRCLINVGQNKNKIAHFHDVGKIKLWTSIMSAKINFKFKFVKKKSQILKGRDHLQVSLKLKFEIYPVKMWANAILTVDSPECLTVRLTVKSLWALCYHCMVS